MALLFMDSFDHYVTADLTEKWTNTGNAGSGVTQTINATGGRRGSGSFRLTTNSAPSNFTTAYVTRTYTPGDTTAIVGVSFLTSRDAAGSAGVPILSIRDGATSQICLKINPTTLTLSVVRGPQNGTVLGTTSVSLSAGVVAHLELKVLIHLSAGTVDLRINGVSVLSLTGQNTRNTANTQWNGLALGALDSIAGTWVASGSAAILDFDDLYVLDGSGSAPWNDFLGDCRVDARLPTAPGATTGFTPLAGANWQNVDDAAPDDDTTYNSAASVLTDTFTVQDAPVAGATIYGVQHCIAAKKTDAGTATLAPVVRHSGVDNVGTSISPSTSYAYGLVVQSVNPGTSAAWVEADFNAAEFGYKRLT